jgi:hypothetical protein
MADQAGWTEDDDSAAAVEAAATHYAEHIDYAAHIALPMMAKTARQAGAALDAFTANYDRGVAREVGQHPDLAELDVRLDGYYGD